MPRIFSFPIGLFLMTVVFPYRHWQNYSSSIALDDAHRVALLLALVLALLILILRPILGSWRNAAMVSVILPFILHMAQSSYLTPLLIALVITIMYATERRIHADRLLASLNGVSLLSLLVYVQVFTFMAQPKTVAEYASPTIGTVALERKPSVVHIVLDGMGSTDILRDLYDLPVDTFNEELKKRGFVVFDQPVAPYNQTMLSMAAITSGGYLSPKDQETDNPAFRRRLVNRVHMSDAINVMREAGYQIAYSRSGISVLNLPNATDVTADSLRLSGLDASLLDYFGIEAPPKAATLGILRDSLRKGMYDGLPSPFYLYQHMIAPHPPFNVTADGRERHSQYQFFADASHAIRGQDDLRREYIKGYREKTLYVWDQLLAQIDTLSVTPRIVIIHGDHGPGAYVDHDSLAETCVKERMTTFLAIYTDDPQLRAGLERASQDSFNLVNLFRLIFSGLARGPVPQLPSKVHYVTWDDLTTFTPVPPDRVHASCPIPG